MKCTVQANTRTRITCRVWNMRDILLKKQQLSTKKTAVKDRQVIGVAWTAVRKK